jgi:hypothetical protein
LCNINDNNYIFKNRLYADCSTEDLPLWIEQIWEVCLTEEDLNIPSQRELLSEKRCHAITTELSKKFSNNIKKFKQLCTKKLIEEFNLDFNAIIQPIIDEYDNKTFR